MKHFYNGLYALIVLVVFTSCSKDELSTDETLNYQVDLSLVHKNDLQMSKDILELINQHRIGMGLNPLILDQQYASAYAVDHTDYMIEVSYINHDNFHLRSQALRSRGATRVGENVAYGYETAEGVVTAWLNSSSHKEIIEGNYTHSGFGVFKNQNDRYFFTQLFYLK